MIINDCPAWLLTQTVTLYNKQPESVIENGGYVTTYAVTVLQGVRYVQQEGANTTASGGNTSDGLNLYIFPNQLQTSKKYVTPYEYNTALEADRGEMWTLQKGCDYVALGEQSDTKPSYEGEKNRNDFKISNVDIRRNPDGSIHHFEVYAR